MKELVIFVGKRGEGRGGVREDKKKSVPRRSKNESISSVGVPGLPGLLKIQLLIDMLCFVLLRQGHLVCITSFLCTFV